jgi:hypothetical protein
MRRYLIQILFNQFLFLLNKSLLMRIFIRNNTWIPNSNYESLITRVNSFKMTNNLWVLFKWLKYKKTKVGTILYE